MDSKPFHGAIGATGQLVPLSTSQWKINHPVLESSVRSSGTYNQSHLVEIRGLIREALEVNLLGPGEAGLHCTDLVAVARAVNLKGLDHHIEERKSLEGQVGGRDRGQK